MAKYKKIWTSTLPAIYYHLDRAQYYHRDEKMKLPKEEFLEIGERDSSGYTFTLKIENGTLANNISNTIVARDLYDVLTQDEHLKKWLQNKSLNLRLNNSFDLSMRCIVLDEERDFWEKAAIQGMAKVYDADEPMSLIIPMFR